MKKIFLITSLLILAFSFKIAFQFGIRHILYLPLIFFVLHFGAGYGFLSNMLKEINKGRHVGKDRRGDRSIEAKSNNPAKWAK